MHSEACNALGASDRVIHSSISHEVVSLRATHLAGEFSIIDVSSSSAANAAEHDECDGIVDNIGAYAHTLCMRTDVPDQLVKLLHQWIENRSINMALRLSLDNCLAERTFWKFVNSEDRFRAVHLVETAMKIVKMNGDEVLRCVDNLRNTT